eukprot:1331502-Prymnesium_polylepis.1
MGHGYAHDGSVRASLLGVAGQVELMMGSSNTTVVKSRSTGLRFTQESASVRRLDDSHCAEPQALRLETISAPPPPPGSPDAVADGARPTALFAVGCPNAWQRLAVMRRVNDLLGAPPASRPAADAAASDPQAAADEREPPHVAAAVDAATADVTEPSTREASSTAASGEEGAVPDAAAYADAPLPSVPRILII